MNPLTRRFARGLARLNTRVQSLERSNQTGYGSLEGGRSIEIRDTSGTVVGTVGGQDDGTVGTVDLVPTAPPAPTTAEAVPGVESVVVRWDGGYAEPVDPQVTISYIGVHLNQNPDDPTWTPTIASELQQITPGGGEVMLSGDSGVETDVVLVSVSAAGVWSAPTAPVSVTPTYAVDIDVVGELVEDVDIIRTDGEAPTSAPTVVRVVEGISIVYIEVEPPADAIDPIVGFGVYVNGTYTRTTPETLIPVAVLADGEPLPYDPETSFAFTAWDADGEGPLSAPVTGAPIKVGDSALAQTILDGIDQAGEQADAAVAAADAATAAALEAVQDAAAAASAAAAAETPEGAQTKADAARDAAVATANGYADTQVATKGKIIAQVSPPSGANANANNLWIDISTVGDPPVAKNTPKVWNGTTWVAITDKVAIDAAATAYAAQQAAAAATAQATTAITAANGKNSNTFSAASAAPATTDRVNGDVHTQVVGGVALKEWTLVAGAWVPRQIDGARLTNVDAASITTGFLNVALLIQAGAISTRELGAGQVTAEKVAADVMVVNDIYAREGLFVKGSGLSGVQIDENGFLQTDAAGASRVNFPSDPSLPNLVRSELITDGITAQGRVALRGVDNEVSRNSAIVLQTGTTPPANSPVIAGAYQTVDAGFDSGTVAGLFRVGTSWYWISDRTLRSRTDAGVYSSQALPFPTADGDGPISGQTSQPVLLGGIWYVVGRTMGGPGYTQKYVYMFNSSTFAYLGKWTLPSTDASDNDSSAHMTVGTDGTNLYTAYYDLNANKTVVCRISSPSTSARDIAQTWVLPPFSGLTSGTKAILLVGNFDFGSQRFIMVQGTATIKVYNPATLTDTSATEAWVTSGANGVGWDGTRFWMQSSQRLYRTSTNKTARTLTGAYTWYDSDPAGGGNYETLLSPIITFTQPARQGLTITTPPPADDGTNNAPDSARFYVGTTTTNLRAQAPGAFLNIATFLDVNPVSGTAPGTNPLFPNGTAALIRSAGSTLVMRGDGTMDVPDPILPVSAVNLRTLDGRAPVGASYTNAGFVLGSGWVLGTVGLWVMKRAGYTTLQVEVNKENFAAGETAFTIPSGFRLLTQPGGLTKGYRVLSNNTASNCLCEIYPDGTLKTIQSGTGGLILTAVYPHA